MRTFQCVEPIMRGRSQPVLLEWFRLSNPDTTPVKRKIKKVLSETSPRSGTVSTSVSLEEDKNL